MALSLERINKAREAGYSDDDIVDSIARKDPEFGSRIKKAKETGYNSSSIVNSIERKLNASTSISENSNSSEIPNSSESPLKKVLNLTPQEREQYGLDIDESPTLSTYTGYGKGLLAGRTLGVSEKIDALHPTEEEKIPYSVGELIGAGKLIKWGNQYIAQPLIKLAQQSPVAQKALSIVAKYTGTGVTGATYGTARQAIATGELPSAADVATHGATWIAIEALVDTLGLGARLASKIINWKDKGKALTQLSERVNLKETNKEKLKTDLEKAIDNLSTEEGALEKVEKPVKKNEVPFEQPKGEANKKIETSQKGLKFKTEKGSTYSINPDGTTTRNKKVRPEHGKSEQGVQPTSQSTRYVSSKDAQKLSEFQTSGEGKKLFQYPDGKLGVQYTNGPNKDKVEARTIVNSYDTPQKGMIPVEMWEDGRRVHFGNKIVSISPKKLSKNKKPKKEKKPPEPIVETTGQGAEKRIEYVQGALDQNIDRANAVIEAAKTPAESLKKLGQATNSAIFNVLAPLERIETSIPVAERVSTRIKLAQSAASEINSVLENGIFSNITGQFEHQGLKGAYGELTWKRLNKGLKPQEYSIQDLDTYRASRVALRRQKEGKKTGIDTRKAQEDVKRLHKKYGPIDQRIREYNKAMLKSYGKDLIGADKIAQWNQKYYAPLFRVMDNGKDSILRSGSLQPKQPFKRFKGSERKIVPPSESDPYNTSMLINNSKKNESVLQYKKLVEEGKLPGKIKKSKNQSLPEELLDDLDIDSDLEELAETLYNQTRKDSFTPRKNVLRGWEDGKPFEIEVPEDVFNIFSTFVPNDNGLVARFFSASNRLFSRGISLDPRKAVSIFGRDAVSSLIYSRTGKNPISIVEALSDIHHDKEIYKQFKAMGGDVYAARLAQRIDRANKIEDLVTKGKEGTIVPFDQFSKWFGKYKEKLGDMSMAVPLAEYKRALQKYGDTAEGRLMAAMEARHVTYDPTRKGGSKIVRELGNYVPFWNVSLQDFSQLGRSLQDRSTWTKGFVGITIPTLALKMINEDNPDYQSLTATDKAAFWHLYFGDHHVRIPIPWLLGTLFKVAPESFFDIAKSRGGEAWKGLYNNFLDNLSGDIPPIFQTYIEWQTGKSLPSPIATFLGGESNAPDVVPRRLQHLPPQYQYTSKTSLLARKFGELWSISPVKLERAIKTNTGILGADALALIDEIAYQTGLAEDKRPAQREANYLLLGNFVTTSPPSRTKYQQRFYELLEEQKHSKEIEKREGKSSSKNLSFLNEYNKRLSNLFKQYRDIESSSVDAKVKKQKLDQKQREINALYKEAVDKAEK